jgi:hypothetical protein
MVAASVIENHVPFWLALPYVVGWNELLARFPCIQREW